MRPQTHRRRTMIALLTPLAALAVVTMVSAVSTSGCAGTDTIDDDASVTDGAIDDETSSDGSTVDSRGDALADTSNDSSAIDETSDGAAPDVTDAADTSLDAPDARDADADVRDTIGAGDTSSSVPPLGAAATFAVLGGSTVTSTGATSVNGNLGVWPGLAVSGFPPGVVIGGTIDKGGPTSEAAQASLTTLYDTLKGAACDTDMSGTDLSGKILKPGVYCFSSSAAITTVGTLTLDAKGDPNAFWIFQISSTLTTPDGAAVVVINGGTACNVFWQVGSSATIGKLTRFDGNIVAFSSITVMTGASVSGRVLARNAAVTLDDNAVAFSTCLGGGLGDAGVDAGDAPGAVDAADVGDVLDVDGG